MNIQEIATRLERNEELHFARLLILINAFEEDSKPAIEGITKLAKLDFLLRYPTYFEKAIVARGGSIASVPVADYEKGTVEAAMVRYRYGPWDHRLRRFVNILAAKRLLTVAIEGRTVKISPTEAGRRMAQQMASHEEFALLDRRSRLLKKRLNLGATQLMKFIYDTFPEIASLEYDEGIKP